MRGSRGADKGDLVFEHLVANASRGVLDCGPLHYPNVTIISANPEQALADLRAKPGKDIWRFGGGSLFRSLLEARLVDAVEVSVIPVLLGEGISLLPPKPSSERFGLKLTSSRTFETGIVSLEYAVEYEPA